MTPKLNASSRILLEEAKKQGIRCTTFADNETLLMEYEDRQWYTRGSRTSFQSSVGKTIADYKPLTKQILSHFGHPTGKWVMVSRKEGLTNQVIEQLKTLKYPVVMKPLDERHGKGVIVGLQNIDDLTASYTVGTGVLVEEQLTGVEYRIICVDYQFVAAAFRKPAFVVGDGSSTIRQLIEKKNAHPWRGESHENNLTTIKVDEEMKSLLKQEKLTLDDVLPVGREVVLRKTANLSTGGEAWNVSDQVHQENKALFEAIAKNCDLNVIGIDVMCEHIDQPILTQPTAGIIEVNASPGLRMHHYPIQGEVINVAGKIIDLCLREIEKKA